jgi:hypothetical protein
MKKAPEPQSAEREKFDREQRLRVTARIIETRAAMICCAADPIKMARTLAKQIPPGCISDGGIEEGFYLRIAAWEILRREQSEEPFYRTALQATPEDTAAVVGSRSAH